MRRTKGPGKGEAVEWEYHLRAERGMGGEAGSLLGSTAAGGRGGCNRCRGAAACRRRLIANRRDESPPEGCLPRFRRGGSQTRPYVRL
jgi:hypothetical protein